MGVAKDSKELARENVDDEEMGDRMKRCTIVLGILALATTCVACKQNETTLSLLVWEGYADPSFVRAFEKRTTAKSRLPTWVRAMSWSPSCAAEAPPTMT